MKDPNKRYTDPCNCYDTYYCLNYVVKREQCAEGTAFDGKICDHEDKVLFEDCDVDNPWLRCNVSGKKTPNDTKKFLEYKHLVRRVIDSL